MSSKMWFLVLIAAMGLIQAQEFRFATNVEIYPANATMEAGDILRFTAVVRSHSGMMHTPQNLQWYATGGSIDQQGKYVAGQTNGTYTITVSYGGHRATATVEIKSFGPSIARVEVSPSNIQMRVGESYRFTATAYDTSNRPVTFTPYWQTSGGGNIDSSGNFYASVAGSYTITATDPQSNKYGTAVVRVGQHHPNPVVARIDIYPRECRVRTGQTQQFTATAYDNYGQVVPNVNLEWKSFGGSIDSSGRYVAGYQAGRYQVTATVRRGNVQGSAIVEISGGHTPPPPSNARIVVTRWNVGGGNFFKPSAKIHASVHGSDLQTVKLYAVSPNDDMDELQAFSVSDGQEVRFDCSYDRFNTKWLEIRLYNNWNQVVAKDKRSSE